MSNKENLLSKEKTTKQNRVWLRIASACNSSCLFCLDSESQNGTFPKEDETKKQILSGIKKGHENRIIISGGEASINPKFHEYIRYAKEVGYDRVQTITNGIMFSKEEFCEKVFSSGLDEVTFSLHGHTKELHDYLTGTPHAFEKALRGLLNVKKKYPHVIVNIDIVVNKINVQFLPKIVEFYMRLGVYEFDILQIIPFGRGFGEYKDMLFYDVSEYGDALKKTWELSKIPGMYMWTNRFPAEAFEGYEDLIQDPRKIRPEVMGESYEMFDEFIKTNGEKTPSCLGESCDVCFLNQYCHDFLNSQKKDKNLYKDVVAIGGKQAENTLPDAKYLALRGEEFPSDVYKKYGENASDFLEYIQKYRAKDHQKFLNIPLCIQEKNNDGEFEYYDETEPKLESYTKKYILNYYRKKSSRCKQCIHNNSCEGIHINFIRSYGFNILKPITK